MASCLRINENGLHSFLSFEKDDDEPTVMLGLGRKVAFFNRSDLGMFIKFLMISVKSFCSEEIEQKK